MSRLDRLYAMRDQARSYRARATDAHVRSQIDVVLSTIASGLSDEAKGRVRKAAADEDFAYAKLGWIADEISRAEKGRSLLRGNPRAVKRFLPGERVRLSGDFLRATGQYAGKSGLSRWTVVPCSCGLCTSSPGQYVAVDEKSGTFPDEPMHVHVGNLEKIRGNPEAKAVRCAWCGKLMSGDAAAPDSQTSHTICAACKKKLEDDDERGTKKNVPQGVTDALSAVDWRSIRDFPGGVRGYVRYVASRVARRNPLLMTVGGNPRRRSRNPSFDEGELVLVGGTRFKVTRHVGSKLGTTTWWLTGAKGSRWVARPYLDPHGDVMEAVSMSGSAGRPLLDKYGRKVEVEVVHGKLRRRASTSPAPAWAKPMAARMEMSNPTLMIVAGNPPDSAVAAAWGRFHQRRAFDGRKISLPAIPGGPATMFALGWCDSLDFGAGDAKCAGARPLVCCDPSDQSLWIVAQKSAMNLSRCKGKALKALTYDPVAESGKEDALFRHDFDSPRPRLAPVGDAARCRAALLEGGRYTVTDWIRN
jgi:hypothetical protein